MPPARTCSVEPLRRAERAGSAPARRRARTVVAEERPGALAAPASHAAVVRAATGVPLGHRHGPRARRDRHDHHQRPHARDDSPDHGRTPGSGNVPARGGGTQASPRFGLAGSLSAQVRVVVQDTSLHRVVALVFEREHQRASDAVVAELLVHRHLLFDRIQANRVALCLSRHGVRES